MDRRHFLGLTAAAASAALLFRSAARVCAGAEGDPHRLQKAGIFPAVKQRRILEDVFKPRGMT